MNQFRYFVILTLGLEFFASTGAIAQDLPLFSENKESHQSLANNSVDQQIERLFSNLKRNFSIYSDSIKMSKVEKILQLSKSADLKNQSYATACEVALKGIELDPQHKSELLVFPTSFLNHCEFNPKYVDPLWKPQITKKRQLTSISLPQEKSAMSFVENGVQLKPIDKSHYKVHFPSYIKILFNDKSQIKGWFASPDALYRQIGKYPSTSLNSDKLIPHNHSFLQKESNNITSQLHSPTRRSRSSLTTATSFLTSKVFWSIAIGAVAAITINNSRDSQNKKPAIRDGF